MFLGSRVSSCALKSLVLLYLKQGLAPNQGLESILSLTSPLRGENSELLRCSSSLATLAALLCGGRDEMRLEPPFKNGVIGETSSPKSEERSFSADGNGKWDFFSKLSLFLIIGSAFVVELVSVFMLDLAAGFWASSSFPP